MPPKVRYTDPPPDQADLKRAQDLSRNAQLALLRQAIFEGVRAAQLPREIDARAAQIRASTPLTAGYPADIPDAHTTIPFTAVGTTVNEIIWTPRSNRMLLGVLATSRETSSTVVRNWIIGTEPSLSSTGQQENAIGFGVTGGLSIFFLVGRGMPVTRDKPLRVIGIVSSADLMLTLFHAPVRE